MSGKDITGIILTRHMVPIEDTEELEESQAIRDFGTIGIIEAIWGRVYRYTISQLPLEAQERQKLLGRKLEIITDLSYVEGPLMFTNAETDALVKQLAEDYSAYHQHVLASRPIPPTADAFNAGRMAKMFCATPIQAYPVAATASPSAWSEYVPEKENELILGFAHKNSHVLMKEDITGQDREKVLARMKKSTTDMGDYDSDLYMMMILQLAVGSRNINGNVMMTMDRVLNYHGARGKKNPKDRSEVRTGGQRWEDREKWGDSYLRMKNKWMKLDEVELLQGNKPGGRPRRNRTTISREAPLFMFGEELRHNTLPLDGGPGKSVLVAWEYREATWMLPFVRGTNAYTEMIMQDCFMFDPFHEKWEKRLSKHFFFWLRTNVRDKEKTLVCIRDLFNEYNLEIDTRNPQRTREHFENAMNVLARKVPRTEGTKDVLAGAHLTWDYANGFDPSKLPTKGWLETWLAQQIIVDLPDEHPSKLIEETAQDQREYQQSTPAIKKKVGRPPGSKNKKSHNPNGHIWHIV